MAHAKLSPSSSDRWMTCPGSVALSEGMPNHSSAAAQEGTEAHAIAERILRGEAPPGDVDKDVLMNVKMYVDHVLDLASADGNVLHVEVNVRLTQDVYGTADSIIWDAKDGVLYVRDLKYGMGLVEVEDNPQLKIYGLAALKTMAVLAKYVDVGIVQPRAPHANGPIRTVRYRTVDLLDFYADVVDAVEATRSPDAKLQPGEHCRFCLGAVKCPEMKRQAQENAKLVFAQGAAYDKDELARLLRWIPTLTAWAKSVSDFAYFEAVRGEPPPGYKIVAKTGNRKWSRTEQEVCDAIANAVGLQKEAMYTDPQLKSPAQVEKLIPKADRKIINDLTSRESSGHSLVKEEDPREAVQLDAKSVFAPIAED